MSKFANLQFEIVLVTDELNDTNYGKVGRDCRNGKYDRNVKESLDEKDD